MYLGGGHLDLRLRLLLAETLHALPPALIFTAEFDPLRDEAKQYAAGLERAGIAVRCMRYQGALDGYSKFAGFFPQADPALSEAALFIQHTSPSLL